MLRWELVLPGELDGALAYLQRLGHRTYFIGDPFEAVAFAERFNGQLAVQNFDRRQVPDLGPGFVAYDLNAP